MTPVTISAAMTVAGAVGATMIVAQTGAGAEMIAVEGIVTVGAKNLPTVAVAGIARTTPEMARSTTTDPDMSATHRLKTWPEYYVAIQEGRKPFELRFNDRNFQVGDKLILEEFVPCEDCGATGKYQDETPGPGVGVWNCPTCEGAKGKFTGRGVTRYVSYILPGTFGLKDGWIIMGISKSRL
jgi:ubiquitin